MFDVTIFSALLGGVLTFLAPCTLPLIPAYLGFLGGAGAVSAPIEATALRRKIFFNALLFTLGFSLVFVLFGVLSGALGRFFILHRAFIAALGGVFVTGFGITMLADIPFPRLFKSKGLPAFLHHGRPTSAFLLGLLFALGWSPCLGPILGTILVLAGASGTALYGAFLLAVYSLGLALPFLAVALLYGSAFTYVPPLARFLPLIAKVAGVLLIVIGVLLMSGKFGLLNTLLGMSSDGWYGNLVNSM